MQSWDTLHSILSLVGCALVPYVYLFKANNNSNNTKTFHFGPMFAAKLNGETQISFERQISYNVIIDRQPHNDAHWMLMNIWKTVKENRKKNKMSSSHQFYCHFHNTTKANTKCKCKYYAFLWVKPQKKNTHSNSHILYSKDI